MHVPFTKLNVIKLGYIFLNFFYWPNSMQFLNGNESKFYDKIIFQFTMPHCPFRCIYKYLDFYEFRL